MNNDYDGRDEEWVGLEPEQPGQTPPWLVWAGVALVVVVVSAICVGSAYLLVNQFEARTAGAPTLAPPTPPGGEGEEGEGETAVSPEPATTDAPNLAPTATLPGAATPTRGNVEAVRLETPPTIDAGLDDWPADAPTYESSHLVFSNDNWDGTRDLTAVWRLGWDGQHLYVGVVVADDTHVQTQTGNQIFRGDSVDIQFDTERAGDFGPRLSPDDYQITLSPGDFGDLAPAAFRFRGTENGRILDAPGGHNVRIDARQTGDGYVLEAAIPWTDLDVAPRAGLVLGMALNANDNDTPETAVQEVMMSHIATRTLTDPTTWGTLVLR